MEPMGNANPPPPNQSAIRRNVTSMFVMPHSERIDVNLTYQCREQKELQNSSVEMTQPVIINVI
ncbi:hypothetical protein T10_2798 [Trichinella papuae]|uniref:Uncharacterized protein n=1 Tax=Trichinella papuae TaxID=268474 RepID=A0A0V1M0S4_9BILA|nr:hypothetical protein T10_1066 [Trichinella papuae]KRZ65338.1 hypothetical protein T10_2798 [Trichinella papuae]